MKLSFNEAAFEKEGVSSLKSRFARIPCERFLLIFSFEEFDFMGVQVSTIFFSSESKRRISRFRVLTLVWSAEFFRSKK